MKRIVLLEDEPFIGVKGDVINVYSIVDIAKDKQVQEDTFEHLYKLHMNGYNFFALDDLSKENLHLYIIVSQYAKFKVVEEA